MSDTPFIRAILAEPTDPVPQMIYDDYRAERGQDPLSPAEYFNERNLSFNELKERVKLLCQTIPDKFRP